MSTLVLNNHVVRLLSVLFLSSCQRFVDIMKLVLVVKDGIECFYSHAPFSLQIDAKREQLSDAKRELKSAKADAKVRRDEKSKK